MDINKDTNIIKLADSERDLLVRSGFAANMAINTTDQKVFVQRM